MADRIIYRYLFIIKDIINDTNEQPDEKVYRARSTSVLNKGSSVPTELGLHYPLGTWVHFPIWKLSKTFCL